MSRKIRAYINTTVLISLANPRDPNYSGFRRSLRRALSEGHVLLTSTITFLELYGKRSYDAVKKVIKEFGIKVNRVNEEKLIEKAREAIAKHRYSRKRMYDIAHVYAALTLKCDAIVSNDRFINRYGRRKGLKTGRPQEVFGR